MRNSEKITQTFNGTVEWLTAGHYFKLMYTVNPVTVELFNKGERVHRAVNVEGGHYQRIDFDRVQITTGANEAVSWLYAPQEGGSDRFTGAFSVTSPLLGDNADNVAPQGSASLVGTIARLMAYDGVNFDRLQVGGVAGSLLVDPADRAARLLGIIASIAATVNVNDVGQSYVTAVQSTVALGAGGVENLIAAASNTGGYTVHDMEIVAESSFNSRAGVCAKATAPTFGVDGALIMLYNVKTAPFTPNVLAYPKRIPAGLRLDRVTPVSEIATYFSLKYTIN